MSILNGKQASKYVSGMINPDDQIQPCGIDLTLKTVADYANCGSISTNNATRILSTTVDLRWMTMWDGSEGGRVILDRGPYLITLNEIVDVPKDCMAMAFPRSSLLRCGVTVETAVWDPGYKGRSQCMMVVHHPEGFIIRKNAKVLQLVFVKLDEDAATLYDGIYQGENLH